MEAHDRTARMRRRNSGTCPADHGRATWLAPVKVTVPNDLNGIGDRLRPGLRLHAGHSAVALSPATSGPHPNRSYMPYTRVDW